MTILPLAYLPSVEYCAYLLRGECIVDLGEHFIKRSERNRTRILSPNGVLDLTVQVCNANRPRTPMWDVRIDYSKRWPHQHWGALIASYKGSPYFEYYAAQFEPFYKNEFGFLARYNLALLEMLCAQVGLPMPRISESYVEAAEGDLDLRPKAWIQDVRAEGLQLSGTLAVGVVQQKSPAFTAEPYVQVFADRMPFVPNLSIADLLFAEGPLAASVLRRCLP